MPGKSLEDYKNLLTPLVFRSFHKENEIVWVLILEIVRSYLGLSYFRKIRTEVPSYCGVLVDAVMDHSATPIGVCTFSTRACARKDPPFPVYHNHSVRSPRLSFIYKQLIPGSR